MNPKRVAGIVNLIAAVVFIGVGVARQPTRVVLIVIGVAFLILGMVRLYQTRSGPPAA